VQRFGQGELRITDYKLVNLEPGSQARFESMRFEATLFWMETPTGECTRSTNLKALPETQADNLSR